MSLPAGNGPVYACAVMGKATDANGGSFTMKLSCRINGVSPVAAGIGPRVERRIVACNRRHKLTIAQTTATAAGVGAGERLRGGASLARLRAVYSRRYLYARLDFYRGKRPAVTLICAAA